MTRLSFRSKIQNSLLAIAAFFFCYLIFETIVSILYVKGKIEPFAVRVHESTGSGQHYTFDPVKGYVISDVPARFGVYTSDKQRLESKGVLVGNNEGFPDGDDFFPGKTSKDELRVAVFGDSFTAAQFIDKNWPERVQDKFRTEGFANIVLYNFSFDAAGFANWWSVIENFLVPNEYDLDAVIFYLRVDDLNRKFFWWDDAIHQSNNPGEPQKQTGNYSASWDPQTFPKSRQDLDESFLERWHIISPAEFDQLEAGSLKLDIDRRFEPYIVKTLRYQLSKIRDRELAHAPEGSQIVQYAKLSPEWPMGDPGNINGPLASQKTNDNVLTGDELAPKSDFPEDAYHHEMMMDIKEFLEGDSIPSLVIIGGDVYDKEHGVEFSEIIGASILSMDDYDIDASPHGNSKEIRLDGHWNQLGSDEFADFIYPEMKAWMGRSGLFDFKVN